MQVPNRKVPSDTRSSKSSRGRLSRHDLICLQWYFCIATDTSNRCSSERSSEGCNSRDAQPSAVSVSALAWGSSVRNTGVRKFTIKFRKGAALLYLIGCNRAAFHIGEQNECQCELLWCYHPAAQTGGIRTLHEKRSQQNRRPNCEIDRCGYYTFDIGADIILSI